MKRLRFCLVILLLALLIFSSSAVYAQVPVTGVSIVVVNSPRGYTPQVPGSPTPPSMNLKPGESAVLRAVVTPTNASNPGVSWKSSDDSIVSGSASSDFILVAIRTGTVLITVISNDDNRITDTITINVRTDLPDPIDVVNVQRLILSSNRIDNVRVGDTFTLVADVYPSNARLTDIKWRSTNDTIARVSRVSSSVTDMLAESKAVIRAEGTGTAEITVYVDYGGTATPVSDTAIIVVGAGPADRNGVTDPVTTRPTPRTSGGTAAVALIPAGAMLLVGGAAFLRRRHKR